VITAIKTIKPINRLREKPRPESLTLTPFSYIFLE